MSQNLPYNLICAKKQQQKTLPNLFPGISVWKGGWDVNPHFPQEKITTASKIGPLGAKREWASKRHEWPRRRLLSSTKNSSPVIRS
jgi:hypothetical protein